MSLRVEFTVEPFVAGAPGPHVLAAVEAAAAHGLSIEFGPFGTSAEGEAATVLPAVEAALRAALDAGASRVSIQVSQVD